MTFHGRESAQRRHDQPVPSDVGHMQVNGDALGDLKAKSRASSRIARSKWRQAAALPFVWIIIVIAFGFAEGSTYLSAANFENIFGSQAVLLVLTLGAIVTLRAGDYDLSMAANLGFSAMLLAILNVTHGVPIVVAIPISLGAGALIGLVNGTVSVLFGIDSFITTLGTSTILAGLILWVSNSNTISGISGSLVYWSVSKRFIGIPVEFYYGLGLCIALWYILEYTPVGQRLLFVGRNRDVARLAGIKVDAVRMWSFVTTGLIAAAAGVLYAGTVGSADPTSSASFLLPAFSAAFLGATCIRPGRFNAWGCFVAVYFLVSLTTGLQIAGASSWVQQLFYGVALIVAVISSSGKMNARLRLRRPKGS
jgi:ribose transport system permease protein